MLVRYRQSNPRLYIGTAYLQFTYGGIIIYNIMHMDVDQHIHIIGIVGDTHTIGNQSRAGACKKTKDTDIKRSLNNGRTISI